MADQTSTIPKGWKMTTLGEVLSIKNGKSRPDDGETYPVYGGNGVLGYSDEYNIDEKIIIVGRVGAYCGSIFLENEKFWLSDNALGVLPKENSNIDFLYYLLKKTNLNKQAIGGAQPLLTQGVINQIEVLAPEDKDEQRAIAAVLSSLDDKIELLREQNKTLEATAQAIFKEWFVDFNFPGATGKMIDSELGKIPEGWRVEKLGKEVETILGGTPSTENNEYWENGTIPWINSGKVNEFRICEPTAYITEKALKESATKIMPKGTVVIAITGATLGQVSRLEIESSGNQSVIGLIANKKIISSYLYYWMLQSIQDIILIATGGAQQHINKNDVNTLDFLIPEESMLSKFSSVADPIIEKISGNCFQINTLSALRDTLLPKLMKGEVRVNGFSD
jgi:type I restriction enzyme S subunit